MGNILGIFRILDVQKAVLKPQNVRQNQKSCLSCHFYPDYSANLNLSASGSMSAGKVGA